MSNNNCYTTDSLLPPNSKYKIYEKIGSGAYGEVYKGTRDDDGLSVALKRVMITDEESCNNIPLSTHRELNVLRRLNKIGNDNIVRLFDIVLNKIGDRMCIDLVFELSDFDLETWLKQYNIGGDMIISKILNLGQQLMDGVHFMHSYRVLHRDLKPANILIDRQGTNLKITDFGLARILGFDAALTPIAVTLWYRSPEILFKNSYLTACDVWSAGCIIGEMVYGRPLFAAENEVKQMEKIVCRLGYEAVDHWPEDSFIDSSCFLDAIDPGRSLNRVLRRADAGLRGLIKALLRFDPEQRMLSSDALVRLKELRNGQTNSNGHMPCTCRNTSIGGVIRMCSMPECVSDAQDFTVVNSVVRNVLDDDFIDLSDIPGLTEDCQSIQGYPHEEVEVTESSDISLNSSQRSQRNIEQDEDDNYDDLYDEEEDNRRKESDEVGDSFSSYRSQNNESFSSYAPSSHTGVESTDEDVCETGGKDLNELHEFNDAFIIHDGSGSDTYQADLSRTAVEIDTIKDDTIIEVEDSTAENSPPSSETVGLHISPFTIALDHNDAVIADDDTQCKLTRQKSIPLQEVNRPWISDPCLMPATQKHIVTRKRIISSDDEEEENDECDSDNEVRDKVTQEVENNSPCKVAVNRPVLARNKSLRRRLSVLGPHQCSDRKTVHGSLARRASTIAIPASINESDYDSLDHDTEIQNQSFGERSLSRALDVSVGVSPRTTAPALLDRPKIIIRRRSQYK